MSQITPARVRDLLDPAAGLARSFQIVRHPDPPHLYLMVVDIGTRFGGTDEPTLHDLTGAYDLRADGAALRGLGEAVERRALAPLPGEGVAGTRAALAASGEPLAPADEWPGHFPLADDDATTWYTAERLGDDSRVLVPAEWVDCPVQGPAAEWWEGTPSGAAAHTTVEAATATAVSEVLERDALMRAWYRQDRADAVELDLTSPHPDLRRLVDDQPGVRVRAARLHTALAGRFAYVAWVDDGTTVGTGATLAADDTAGAARSVLEAWQIYLALRTRAKEPRPAGRGSFVDQGEARCDFWAYGEGRAAMAEWARGLRPVEPLDQTPSPQAGTDLVSELVSVGLPVLRVDLGPRLPAAVRAAGFVAVKVLVGGTHPLVLEERAAWSFVDPLLGERRPVPYQPLI
ncbi:YcaO-like family protein [Georgenia satyanarayanai]|nr:YcaO-like family protein [Georgenia satyanarayanai]